MAHAGPVGRLVALLRHHLGERPAGLPARVPPPAGPGGGLSADRPTLWDIDFRTAVSQAELEDRDRPGAYYRLRFRRPGPEGGSVDIETTRPELLPACVALVAHPDDERYQACSAPRSSPRSSACGSPSWPTSWPIPRRGPASPWSARSATPPTWCGGGSSACPPGRSSGRDGRLAAVPWGEPGWESDDPWAAARPTTSSPASPSARPRPRIVELLAEAGALIGEPEPITHPVKFYERGERPLEIVSIPAVVRPHRSTLRSGCWPGAAELRWHPPHMAHRYAAWVEGLSSRLEHQPTAVLRGPLPGLVPGRRRRAARLRRARPGRRGPAAGRPVHRRPRRLRRGAAGAPGGFVGDPDVMDTWATSSLTPQIAGADGRRPRPVRPGLPDGPAAPGPRDHPDLAVLRRRAVRARVRLPPVAARRDLGLGPRPRPEEDVQVQGQRGHPAAAARAARRRRGALLGGQRPARHRHRRRRGPDEGGAPPRHQGPQRLPVRARPPLDGEGGGAPAGRGGPGGRRAAVTDRSTGPCSPGWPTWSTRPPRRSRTTTTPGPWSGPRRSSGPSATTTWSWSSPGPTATRPRPGPPRRAGRAGLALSVQLRLFAPFLPFVTEEVWSWWQDGLGAPGPLARAERARPPSGAGADPAALEVLDVVSEVLGQVRRAKTGAKRSMRAPVALLTVTDRPDRLAALPWPRTTCATPAGWSSWSPGPAATRGRRRAGRGHLRETRRGARRGSPVTGS